MHRQPASEVSPPAEGGIQGEGDQRKGHGGLPAQQGQGPQQQGPCEHAAPQRPGLPRSGRRCVGQYGCQEEERADLRVAGGNPADPDDRVGIDHEKHGRHKGPLAAGDAPVRQPVDQQGYQPMPTQSEGMQDDRVASAGQVLQLHLDHRHRADVAPLQGMRLPPQVIQPAGQVERGPLDHVVPGPAGILERPTVPIVVEEKAVEQRGAVRQKHDRQEGRGIEQAKPSPPLQVLRQERRLLRLRAIRHGGLPDTLGM